LFCKKAATLKRLASNLNFYQPKRLIMMTKSTSKELALLKKAAIVNLDRINLFILH
jgi:hypothetical protein